MARLNTRLKEGVTFGSSLDAGYIAPGGEPPVKSKILDLDLMVSLVGVEVAVEYAILGWSRRLVAR